MPQFAYLYPCYGHLGCFQFGVVMHKAALNILIHIFYGCFHGFCSDVQVEFGAFGVGACLAL